MIGWHGWHHRREQKCTLWIGDKVIGMLGWAEMGVSDGVLLRKLDTSHIPISAYLGAAGMPV